MFSSRMPQDWSPSPWSEAVESARLQGRVLHDLTLSAPWSVGLGWDRPQLDQWMSTVDWLAWQPEPRGSVAVREVLARQNPGTHPAEYFLTAGTSDAYSALFRMLCDPGDAVLVPRPGYPLLDVLAGLDGLDVRGYDVVRSAGEWRLDAHSLPCGGGRVKAVLVVEPSNPLGSYLGGRDWNVLVEYCEKCSASLIVDEVFSPYRLHESEQGFAPDYAAMAQRLPVFRLDGLSKRVGLPQLKLSWIWAGVPAAWRERLHHTLEYCLDAFLSVSSTAQAMAVPLLENQRPWQQRVVARVRSNSEWVADWARQAGYECPRVAGGWYAAVRIPGCDDEAFCLRALQHHGVLLQPGYFFDFSQNDWVVVSLLPIPENLKAGLQKLQPPGEWCQPSHDGASGMCGGFCQS